VINLRFGTASSAIWASFGPIADGQRIIVDGPPVRQKALVVLYWALAAIRH